jgi:hypothetical protein
VGVSSAFPNPITHYYICKRGKYGSIDGNTFSRLKANDTIYCPAEYWRPAMIRSAPDMHGSIDSMRQFNDTVDNVAGKINLESRLISVETKGAVGKLPGRLATASTDSAGNSEKVRIANAERLMRLQVNGDPDSFQLQEMKNPGQTFDAYMMLAVRIFSAGFGLPAEMVLHIFTNGSYTANRMARADFKRTIMGRWEHRRKILCQPTWNWAIARAIKNGDLDPAPVDPSTGFSEWHRATWSTPRFEMIDEGKEAAADEKLWGIGRASLAQFAREQQTTPAAILNERKDEVKMMQEAAADVGVDLHTFMSGLFAKQELQQTNGATP